jgi:hypothetical protein
MRIVKISLAVAMAFSVAFRAEAQTQDSYEYQSEFTWGFNKNTSGGLIGGLVFKKAKKMNVKHRLERRVNSPTGNFYIYGKSNYLYAIRFQYGRDIILFKKASQQGVEIKSVFALGPTIGLVAPYYVEYQLGQAGQPSGITTTAQYDPKNVEMSSINILGTGRLFQGIGDSKIVPGLNFKAALNFELGTIKSQVTGFEAGFLLDAYSKKIELMPESNNYSVFPTLFVTLFYGGRK